MAKKSPFSKNDISSIEKLKVNEKIYTYLLEKEQIQLLLSLEFFLKQKLLRKLELLD